MKIPNRIISTERLGMRHWLESDIFPLAEMNSDKQVMQFFPKTLSFDESVEMLNRINNHFDRNGFGLYAVELKSSNEFIGFTGFSIPSFNSHFTPCIEIGWRYKKEVWGNGYATEAARACLQYGFDTLKFDKILSFTAVVNKPSEKLMKRIAMQFKGRFEHPNIEKDHPLCEHVLYQSTKEDIW
jgi:[ribosomal protein S5]-alanine N-acetyltransferase